VKIQISILTEPGAPKDIKPEYKQPSTEERVKEAIERCESGYDSDVDWEFIRRVNNTLMKIKNRTPKQTALLKLMKPVIAKYGQHDHNGVELDPEI